MKQLTVAIACAFITTACFGLGYETPTGPTRVGILPLPVPSKITSSVLYGTGNGAGRAFLVVTVSDASGRGIAAPVTFTVTDGTIAAGSDVLTTPTNTALTLTTDTVLGQAQVTVVGHGPVSVALRADPALTTVSLFIP